MSVRLLDPLIAIERCPHCQAFKPTLNLMYQWVDARSSVNNHGPGWLIYRCSACFNAVTFKTPKWQAFPGMDPARTHLHQTSCVATEMIPSGQIDLAGLPSRAERYLSQAIGSITAPDGAVMLAGSAVDAMLKEKGYDKGNVYDRIRKAVDDHILTADMAEWAHAVRLEANKPRHADLDDPHASEEEAKQSIEFVKALGDFLFVLPARVEAGKAAANQS